MICVIPARGGSRRIPNKNIRDFHGKPIIAYSIELGKKTCDRVIVSTDDDEIAAVALAYGAEVHERPSELAKDEIGTQEVIGGVIKDIGLQGDIMCLYATSPLISVTNIQFAKDAHDRDPFLTCRYSTNGPEPSGGFYIANNLFFRVGYDPYKFGFPWPTEDIDINTIEDWKLAEQLYEERYGH